MRPLTIITGIVLGSSFSIAFGLAVVIIIFLIIGGDYPVVRGEFNALGRSAGLFTSLTLISAMSFLTLLKNHRLWLPANLLMWAAVGMIGLYFWPDS